MDNKREGQKRPKKGEAQRNQGKERASPSYGRELFHP
jgi:hypothetical protein